MSRDFRLLERPSTTPAHALRPEFSVKRMKSAQIDRIAYREEAKAMVRKHRSKIEFLVQQNNALKEKVISIHQKDLGAAPNNLLASLQTEQNIRGIHEEIQQEQAAHRTVSEQIKIFQSQILVERQKTAGSHLNAEHQQALVRTIKALENRLDQATQKFNEQVSANTQLRNQIDSFKKERSIFQKFSKKSLPQNRERAEREDR